MILSPWRTIEGEDEIAPVTVDELIAGILGGERADGIVADAADKARWSDRPPLRLTYGQLDEAVNRLASLLQRFHLPADSVVAVKMPNGVEAIVTLLAVIRAGMIPAMLPPGAAETDLVHLARLVGARALVGAGRVGDEHWGQELRRVAGAVFSVRFLFSFGMDLPPGAVPLDEAFAPDAPVARPAQPRRDGEPADHVALITFDNAGGPWRAVARNHRALVAIGLDTALAWSLDPRDAILATMLPSGLAGLATGLLPALVTGAGLTLAHPFQADTVTEAILRGAATHLALPAELADAVVNAIKDHAPDLLLGLVWRDPAARLTALPASDGRRRVDMLVLGQTALLSTERRDGIPASLSFRNGRQGFAAFRRDPAGRIEARGALVGNPSFPPQSGGESVDQGDGWVATGLADPQFGLSEEHSGWAPAEDRRSRVLGAK